MKKKAFRCAKCCLGLILLLYFHLPTTIEKVESTKPLGPRECICIVAINYWQWICVLLSDAVEFLIVYTKKGVYNLPFELSLFEKPKDLQMAQSLLLPA